MNTNEAMRSASVANIDMKLEVVVIPVSDVDRAKEFYTKLGWRLDVTPPGVVQFTPPGSGASVTFGQGLTTAAPGSAEGGLTVSDIEAAHDELAGRGIDVSDIWHGRDAELAGDEAAKAAYRQAIAAEDFDDAVVWAGEGIDLIHAVEPAGVIVERTVSEAEAALARDQAHLANGQINLGRYVPLAKQGFTPEEQVATQRVMVAEEDCDAARRLLRGAGLGHELRADAC